MVATARALVNRLTRSRAAEILGRSESWLARALHSVTEQRLKSGCALSARDLLILLAVENALADSALLDLVAHAALGDDLNPAELAEAWDEIGREHLGKVYDGLRHRVLSRARSKRLRRAPMRTKRSEGR
jgi:hypothetical protein